MDERPRLQHHDITNKIISSFFATYSEQSGFPEFVLRRAMAIAIRDAGLAVDEELPLPVWFRGRQIVKFRADLVVASAVIVEVKARPEIDPFNKAQVLHYLKATDLEVGLLLNFGRRPEFHGSSTSSRGRALDSRPRRNKRTAQLHLLDPRPPPNPRDPLPVEDPRSVSSVTLVKCCPRLIRVNPRPV